MQVIRGLRHRDHARRRHGDLRIVAVSLCRASPEVVLRVYLPGLLAAVTLHSAFNILLVRPVLATLSMLVPAAG